jgi:hypothetical protein
MLGALSQRWRSVASEQDDGDVSRSRVALQIVNQLPSITAAQRQVRNDDVWVKFPCATAGLLTIGGVDCFETERDKALNVKLTRVVVVVDDEYQRSGRRVPRATAVHWLVLALKKSRGPKNSASPETDLSRF